MTNVTVLAGDLSESKAHTLTNAVNTVGVMGKGIALGFKNRFPDMFHDYVRRCENGDVQVGRPYVYKGPTPPWVLNFPTKGHWRTPSRFDDISNGLDHLISHCRSWEIESIAVPALGCGAGGLDWLVVGPLLHQCLSQLEIPVELYAPSESAVAQLTELTIGPRNGQR